MEKSGRKYRVRAIVSLIIAVIVACAFPLLVPMMTVHAELSPALSAEFVTVRVDQTESVRIDNVREDQILSLSVWPMDTTIATVTQTGGASFDITGVTAYEDTEVTAEMELKEEVAGHTKYWFAMKVRVEPDRNLVTDKKTGRAPDYSKKKDWLNLPKHPDKTVDTFFIYSTQYEDDSRSAPDLAPMDDPGHRACAQGLFRGQGPIFEKETNVYAPYYRQTNMREYFGEAGDDPMKYQRHEQKLDICNALDYYFEHYNKGRPFILAGHSQGAMMTLIVLEDYMKRHPEYYGRMIAAYVIGFSVTKQDLATYPHLKFAEGAKDTGVIVSWNTEGAANRRQRNFVVREGSIAINPINWKRDETYARASQNLGSRVLDPETGFYSIRMKWGDAQVDTVRGVVITNTRFMPNSKTDLYGSASYHSKDIALYYNNLIKNVHDRIKAYRKEHRGKHTNP